MAVLTVIATGKVLSAMIQTFQGYFHEDGRFFSNQLPVQLPVGRRAIINFLDDDFAFDVPTDSQKQIKALDDLFAGLKVIDDEPADEAFDAIMSRRFHIGRKLDL
jgi:hypothetical protein